MASNDKKKEKNDNGFFNRLIQGKFPIKRKPKQPNGEEKDEKTSKKIVGFITKPYYYIKKKIVQGRDEKTEELKPSMSKDLNYDVKQQRKLQSGVFDTTATSSKKIAKMVSGKRPNADTNVESSSNRAVESSKTLRSKKRRMSKPEEFKKSSKMEKSFKTEKSFKRKRSKPINNDGSKKSTKSWKKVKKTQIEKTPIKKSTSSEKIDDEYEFIFADNIRAGLQTLKKNFISRPYQPKSMKRMLERLAQRHKRVHSNTPRKPAETPLPSKRERSVFDDCMPKASTTTSSTSTATTKTAISAGSSTKRTTTTASNERTEKETRVALVVEDDNDDFKKKYTPILTNKTNKGKLFLPDGKPFWQGGNTEDDEEEPTDDELPMNADVIEEVYEGKTKLIPMPSDPVTLNPYASMSELKKRDDYYFTKGVIFSNTVRTLLNLNDELTDIEERRKEKTSKSPTRKPTFIEPTHLVIYDRKEPSKVLRRSTIEAYRAETDGVNSEE